MARTHTGPDLKTIVSVLTIAASAIGFGWSQWNGLSTDTERREAINRYDHGHPEDLPDEDFKQGGVPQKTRRKVEATETLVQRFRADQVQDRKNIHQMWWWMIGYSAADREPCHAIRAAASAFYRAQFVREARTETDLETAFTRALNTPWQDRASLVRAAGCR